MTCNIMCMKGLTFLSDRNTKPDIRVGHILTTKIIFYHIVYVLHTNRISYCQFFITIFTHLTNLLIQYMKEQRL